MQSFTRIMLIITAIVVVLSFGAIFVLMIQIPFNGHNNPIYNPNTNTEESSGVVKKFSSDEEFKEYINQASELGRSGYYGGSMMRETLAAPNVVSLDSNIKWGLDSAQTAALGPTNEGTGAPDYSSTNVQVRGIDEPDIVKNNGSEIYFSSQNYYYPVFRQTNPMAATDEMRVMPPYENRSGVQSLKAYPPADLKKLAKIDKYGDLLLYQDKLMIFSGQNIYAYNIKDTANPKEDWQLKLGDNSSLVTSRLVGDELYLVTRTEIYTDQVCPIKPLIAKENDVIVRCIDVYHPAEVVPVDVTYTVMKVKVDQGEVSEKVSFIGSSGSSIVYMSSEAIYVTYFYPGDFIAFLVNFFRENPSVMPTSVVDKLVKLQNYDISDSSKLNELQQVLERYYNALDNDERLRVENELSNKMVDYQKAHKRDLEKTGIVKIAADNLDVVASGAVPGQPLNQFSLDEYQNNLRIATTLGSGNWFGFGSMGESASDVYVLGDDLKIKGAVKDLGLTERIYSVRFIEDKGYVVTFRQTDPFYVLDLADPNEPELKGELKIPGYSAYLHPINKDKILGIGKEGSEVKISLFDVSNPSEPKESAKYVLKEYWSEILNTHHAFLLDSRHNVFFLPGSQGGYIFSYQNDNLELVKAVSEVQAKRALYINDYLYIVGENKLIVLNEQDWERVNELDLQN